MVRPGTDRVAPAAARGRRRRSTLLAVGAVVPRKGYDVLVAALAELADLPWRLDHRRRPRRAIRDDRAAARCRHRASRPGRTASALPARSRPSGSPQLYAAADLFVLPSRFEGYGMAYAEAIAHGVPVVGTTAGAIPDTVPAGAGVLVPPDDVDALAAALRRLIEDPARARTRSRPARARRRRRFRPGGSRPRLFAQASLDGLSDERLFRRMAGAARALRPRARNAAVLDAVAGAFRDRVVDRGGRSRLRHRRDACGRSARGCRRGRTGGWSTTISACWRAPRRWRGRRQLTVTARAVDLVRDLELALDGPIDLVTTLGAARSRLGRMARAAGGRGGGAPAAGLCGAHLRRPGRCSSRPSRSTPRSSPP